MPRLYAVNLVLVYQVMNYELGMKNHPIPNS